MDTGMKWGFWQNSVLICVQCSPISRKQIKISIKTFGGRKEVVEGFCKVINTT